MTEKSFPFGNVTKKKKPLLSAKQLALSFMSLFALALVIKNSDAAIKYMNEGLRLCVSAVIPSLFPFMAVSDIVVRCGAVSLLGKWLCRPIGSIFGVSGDGSCAVLLGFLCGFPIGARSAARLYEEGKISGAELERLLTFSNLPSSAFIINAVGISLFGSRSFGIALYLMLIASAVITGVLQNLLSKMRKKKERIPIFTPLSLSPPSTASAFGVKDLTESIASSATGILRICGFVVFFTAIVGVLSEATDSLAISPAARAALFGAFELTGGISQATSVPSSYGAAVLTAFIAGWSGLSVHFQIMSLCPERTISFAPYFLAKLFQGAFCAALMTLYCLVLHPSLTVCGADIPTYTPIALSNSAAILLSAFFSALLIAISIIRKEKTRK